MTGRWLIFGWSVTMGHVNYVRVRAVRWVDREWPALVEVQLSESNGAVVTLVDKVPVFDGHDSLAPSVEFPVELEVPCDILDRSLEEDGRRSMLVRLHFDIEDQHGRQDFRVDESDVVSRER